MRRWPNLTGIFGRMSDFQIDVARARTVGAFWSDTGSEFSQLLHMCEGGGEVKSDRESATGQQTRQLHYKSRARAHIIQGPSYSPGCIEMSVSTNISGHHMKVKVVWYSIHKRTFESSPTNTTPSNQSARRPSHLQYQNLKPPARAMTLFGSTLLRIDFNRGKFGPYKASTGVPKSA